MTDPSHIEALIARLEKDGGSREASDKYLVLCCGREFHDLALDYYSRWCVSPGEYGTTFGPDEDYKYDDRPCPTTNAQDALDSLPEGLATNVGNQRHGKPDDWFWAIGIDLGGAKHQQWTGKAKTPAAAICLANLRRLEG
jgi:hypothetical protein